MRKAFVGAVALSVMVLGLALSTGAERLQPRAVQFDVPVAGDEGGGERDANAFPVPSQDANSAGGDVGVTLNEVSDHPQPLIGRSVTISGRVGRHFSDRALMLGTSDRVLVIAEKRFGSLIPPTRSLDANQLMQVTGVVRPPGEVRARSFGVPRGALEGYSGGVVMARSIELDPPRRPTEGDTEEVDESAYADDLVTVDDVLAEGDRYIGEQVTVSAEVEKVLNDRAFVLGDSQLLVVSAGKSKPFPEATAVVTGTVKRVDRKLSRGSSFATLDESLLEFFQDKPAIVADDVQVVA